MSETMNKLLSVIVRTMGKDMELLKKAIDSIFRNTYPNIELIVVFQGTDDALFQKIESEVSAVWEYRKIQFIQNKTDEDERSKNLNLGLEAAKGLYIAFLDDDDYVAENHYKNLILAIEKEKTDLAFCIANVVDEKGQPKPGLFEERYIDKLSFYKDNFITIHSFVVTREVIERLDLKFEERLQLAEDYLFLLPIYMKETVSFVEERSCYYRIVSKESQSFTAYEESGKRDQQYKLLKTLRRQYKPYFFQKWFMKTKRLLGLVYQVAED
ncbi:glycosyl transferase [Aequorivita sublithincola DSM 14238]|uniref:Glycosyl transferase n=2 Tax=Aequorivita TaxID=153265 RepID=I3YXL3_AEQSU|nr:glycosyl transferase [Aequorivita sublithincola DSM 14238]